MKILPTVKYNPILSLLHVKYVKVSEIHQQIRKDNKESVLKEGIVRKHVIGEASLEAIEAMLP